MLKRKYSTKYSAKPFFFFTKPIASSSVGSTPFVQLLNKNSAEMGSVNRFFDYSAKVTTTLRWFLMAGCYAD